MFDIGIWELLIVFVILLLVVGPEKIPKVAFTAGKWLHYVKNSFTAASGEIKQQIDQEFSGQYQQEQSEKYRLNEPKPDE